MGLSAVNSINWARVALQIVYYFVAAVALGAPRRPVAFAVPTGNFGNVYAGYAAHRMGLPIARLIVGSNSNDILTRFFASRVMSVAAVQPTLSPSMDIQVSSNFERLLFTLLGGDGAAVARTLNSFRQSGEFALEKALDEAPLELFRAHRLDDRETLAEMARLYEETGELIDPHSAIGTPRPARSSARRGFPWSPWRPPIRPSSRTRSSAPAAAVPPCRRVSRT